MATIFINELVKATSVSFVQKLVDKFGGQRIYVPVKMPHTKHPLSKALSKEELNLLIENFKNEYIDIPMSLTKEAPLRRRKILELKNKKWDNMSIATSTGCCWRWVYKVLANEKKRIVANENQSDLFKDF